MKKVFSGLFYRKLNDRLFANLFTNPQFLLFLNLMIGLNFYFDAKEMVLNFLPSDCSNLCKVSKVIGSSQDSFLNL